MVPQPATPASASSSRAPETPGAPACSRHADMLGPATCRTCASALCSACARHHHHRFCPACLQARARPQDRVSASWLVALWLDALVTAAPRLHRSALPLLAVLSGALATAPVPGMAGLGTWVGDLFLTAVLLSSLATSFRSLPPPHVRLGRGLAAFIVMAVVAAVPALLLAGVLGGLMDTLGGHARTALTVAVVGTGVAGYALFFALQPVAVAACVLLPRTLPRAVTLPLRCGWRAGLTVGVATALALAVGGANALLGWAADPTTASVLGRTLVRAVTWFLQGSVALACVRFLLDAERVRGRPA